MLWFSRICAVSSAVEQGTQMLELDCHLTHDGHIVVSHDENLLRQTGHDVTISSLKLQVGDTSHTATTQDELLKLSGLDDHLLK